jgi:hypothetical protein
VKVVEVSFSMPREYLHVIDTPSAGVSVAPEMKKSEKV